MIFGGWISWWHSSLQIIPPGNRHQVALQQVSLETSGEFTCQITQDRPPFKFVQESGHMTVVALPDRFPVISGLKKSRVNYRLGDRVRLNCTCHDTHPPATMTWYINDEPVSFKNSWLHIPDLDTVWFFIAGERVLFGLLPANSHGEKWWCWDWGSIECDSWSWLYCGATSLPA